MAIRLVMELYEHVFGFWVIVCFVYAFMIFIIAPNFYFWSPLISHGIFLIG